MKKIILSAILILTLSTQVLAETVVFNTHTHKFHKPECSSAIRCTKNCIKIDRKVAILKDGIPCKRCEK